MCHNQVNDEIYLFSTASVDYQFATLFFDESPDIAFLGHHSAVDTQYIISSLLSLLGSTTSFSFSYHFTVHSSIINL